MNYKYLVQEELNDFADKFENYSFCEIIFTILKSANKKAELSWLYELSDRELLTAIENANLKETENED